MKQNKTVYILVKKYFDKVNGNTYHSIQFEFKGKTYHSGLTYGYGTHYEQTTKKTLDKISFDWKKFNLKYIVIENCKKSELKKIHEIK